MSIGRILRFGFDPQTTDYLRQVFLHPLTSVYRLIRTLGQDGEKKERLLLRDLAMGLPDRDASAYLSEIMNLKEIPLDEFSMFPYPSKKGTGTRVESGFDKEKRLPYVVHNGKRFYGPHDQSVDETEQFYRYFVEDEGLLGTGARTKSPHSYVDLDFKVENGDIVVDIGCSDALFAFDNAEMASRIYLFEAWKRWLPAIKASFAPYSEKTKIFTKLVSDKTGKGEIRLSDAIQENESSHYFIKMDIEGGERAVLASAEDFLRGNKVKLSCCVYHRQDDALVISTMLKDLGFSIRYSDGYMLPLCNGMHFPYFRHGVVYARNY